ncbi:unnamed protein product [Rotaria magnacalcarata]|uniref:Peptidoglycan recognition protein family domain-containing protein n=2 Tax=Rotaria magnacalcarata TaxID=392030 RepID=A0A816LTR2_9BILA|nr:unnamed protein product [Rotaria magnacalcarata]CAF2035120.1 unnamed protein product [Rotaria magnacalcarata]CAF4238595.1 unnamed protein product [Rotaria magnacalcarata]
MISTYSSNDCDNGTSVQNMLYRYCQENNIEQLRTILPFLRDASVINKIHTKTGSTCLHVACYRGHKDVVEILLQYGASTSIRNNAHHLTPYEEAGTEDIKQLLINYERLFSSRTRYYIEWSMVGDGLLSKRRQFREMIDLYKAYNNRHLVSKLLTEVIHYYLNEYLLSEINQADIDTSEIIRQQIEIVQTYFQEAINKHDYLTYFIKAYTLTTCFYQKLNEHLAMYILEYFDETRQSSSNYRLVNCLVHIVTLLIYHPDLSLYQFQGVCYRGMRITQNDLDQYQLGQCILNRSFLSTSVDRSIAEMFAGEGQQSFMRRAYQDHRPLQLSCICKYVIKQESTAINIENLSTRPVEKEVLIIPFSVFEVINIKVNPLDSPSKISVEIELKECEDINKSGKFQKCIMHTYPLYSIIGLLLLLVFILGFGIQKTINANMATSKMQIIDDDVDYPVGPDCPNILNRSIWNARPFLSRDYLKLLPVTHIVVRRLGVSNSSMNKYDCAKQIQKSQAYHMDTLGWFDIGFNFIICAAHGKQQIYKGRGWKYIGAHCKGYNARSLGIAVAGNHANMETCKIIKSIIQCGITQNNILSTFTLVGNLEERDIYNYYLNCFINDHDMHYANISMNKQAFCQ